MDLRSNHNIWFIWSFNVKRRHSPLAHWILKPYLLSSSWRHRYLCVHSQSPPILIISSSGNRYVINKFRIEYIFIVHKVGAYTMMIEALQNFPLKHRPYGFYSVVADRAWVTRSIIIYPVSLSELCLVIAENEFLSSWQHPHMDNNHLPYNTHKRSVPRDYG